VSGEALRRGPYRLEGELGRGGMGVVYAAVHDETGQRYALKALPPRVGVDSVEDRLRFAREAEVLARLRHPAIVPVHAAALEGPRPYIVQALLPGGSLAERLADGPLPVEEAVALGARLGRGLAHAHARGVLHRDLKPENVLFDELGAPRLVDFGLARAERAEPLTRSGTRMGSPSYMPPEQAEGAPADARSDVYGLGAVLYHALTGRRPFQGASPLEVLEAVLKGRPEPPRAHRPDLPPAVEAVVLRAMARDPARRFAKADALADALEAAVRPAARRRATAAALAAAALAAAALAAAALALTAVADEPVRGPAGRRDPPAAPPARGAAAAAVDPPAWAAAADAAFARGDLGGAAAAVGSAAAAARGPARADLEALAARIATVERGRVELAAHLRTELRRQTWLTRREASDAALTKAEALLEAARSLRKAIAERAPGDLPGGPARAAHVASVADAVYEVLVAVDAGTARERWPDRARALVADVRDLAGDDAHAARVAVVEEAAAELLGGPHDERADDERLALLLAAAGAPDLPARQRAAARAWAVGLVRREPDGAPSAEPFVAALPPSRTWEGEARALAHAHRILAKRAALALAKRLGDRPPAEGRRAFERALDLAIAWLAYEVASVRRPGLAGHGVAVAAVGRVLCFVRWEPAATALLEGLRASRRDTRLRCVLVERALLRRRWEDAEALLTGFDFSDRFGTFPDPAAARAHLAAARGRDPGPHLAEAARAERRPYLPWRSAAETERELTGDGIRDRLAAALPPSAEAETARRIAALVAAIEAGDWAELDARARR